MATLSWSLLLGLCSQYVDCFVFSLTASRDERGPLGQLFQLLVPKTALLQLQICIVDSSFPQCPRSPKRDKNPEVLCN